MVREESQDLFSDHSDQSESEEDEPPEPVDIAAQFTENSSGDAERGDACGDDDDDDDNDDLPLSQDSTADELLAEISSLHAKGCDPTKCKKNCIQTMSVQTIYQHESIGKI